MEFEHYVILLVVLACIALLGAIVTCKYLLAEYPEQGGILVGVYSVLFLCAPPVMTPIALLTGVIVIIISIPNLFSESTDKTLYK